MLKLLSQGADISAERKRIDVSTFVVFFCGKSAKEYYQPDSDNADVGKRF